MLVDLKFHVPCCLDHRLSFFLLSVLFLALIVVCPCLINGLCLSLWNLQTFVEFNVEMKKRTCVKFSSEVKILKFIFITTGSLLSFFFYLWVDWKYYIVVSTEHR